jgi:hypothetical protein
MRSSEVMTECPVCLKVVSKEHLNKHIGQLARREKKSNLQVEKKHLNYKRNVQN